MARSRDGDAQEVKEHRPPQPALIVRWLAAGRGEAGWLRAALAFTTSLVLLAAAVGWHRGIALPSWAASSVSQAPRCPSSVALQRPALADASPGGTYQPRPPPASPLGAGHAFPHGSFTPYRGLHGRPPAVPTWIVTPANVSSTIRFYDTSAFSPSGRFLALLEFPPGAEGRAINVDKGGGHAKKKKNKKKKPSAPLAALTAAAAAAAGSRRTSRSFSTGDAGAAQPLAAASVVVVDLATGEARTVATTRGWDSQTGAHVQWGASDAELFFNDVVEDVVEGVAEGAGEDAVVEGAVVEDAIVQGAVVENAVGARGGRRWGNSRNVVGGGRMAGEAPLPAGAAAAAAWRAVGVRLDVATGARRLLDCPIYQVGRRGAPLIHASR